MIEKLAAVFLGTFVLVFLLVGRGPKSESWPGESYVDRYIEVDFDMRFSQAIDTVYGLDDEIRAGDVRLEGTVRNRGDRTVKRLRMRCSVDWGAAGRGPETNLFLGPIAPRGGVAVDRHFDTIPATLGTDPGKLRYDASYDCEPVAVELSPDPAEAGP